MYEQKELFELVDEQDQRRSLRKDAQGGFQESEVGIGKLLDEARRRVGRHVKERSFELGERVSTGKHLGNHP